ncbi:MAG: lysoplasmalogenase [Actinomycetota bacterium]
MNGATQILLVLGAAAALVDWWAVHRRDKSVEYVAKPAVMVFLIAAAVALDPIDPARRDWFVMALILSLAGDVFLMLPDRFIPGLASFLLAHGAYIIGFQFRPEHLAGSYPELGAVGVGVIAAFFLAVVLLVGRRILAGARESNPKLAIPVAGYMAAIATMVLVAMADFIPLAVAGAALFFLSDTLIGFNRFVRPAPWMPVAIIATYHLAQFGLVASLIR